MIVDTPVSGAVGGRRKAEMMNLLVDPSVDVVRGGVSGPLGELLWCCRGVGLEVTSFLGSLLIQAKIRRFDLDYKGQRTTETFILRRLSNENDCLFRQRGNSKS